jgi:DNA-binding response OmpR family regulator
MSKTIFKVLLPIGKEHLINDELIEETPFEMIGAESNKKTPATDYRLPDTGHRESSIPDEKCLLPVDSSGPNLPRFGQHQGTILIVEDHKDVRRFIRYILGDQYRILQAEDGGKGFKMATERQPDLIISDVMMPRMDGYEFCRCIKEDQQTSHIPMILLTARADHQDRLTGLETGADAYLTKPFDAEELRVQSRNLIEQRRKLRERFVKDPFVKAKEITVTSSDEKFLSQIFELVEQDLSNPELNVSHLMKNLGFSHAGLHRKVKALTGVSPVEFIRLIRLHRARQLLEKNFGNVSQIAFEVGFNSLSFFSYCFNKRFGITPSSLLKLDQV